MKRWTKGIIAALAVMSIAIAGCQDQGADESLDLSSIEAAPSIDVAPSDSGATDSSDSALPSDDSMESEDASPSGS